ncbi:MAG: single-stranded-DNA-specific exonuclease RecJ [Desulfocapsa sp.]|nr:single-stranded-DNA-specific exonuclease RecJ [Desulfocapsa sp.]
MNFISNKERLLPRLSNGTTLDPLIAQILSQRDIKGREEIINFLQPRLQDLPSPYQMKDMDIAVSIVEKGIKKNLPILILGDYDVDGTTATALLVDFLGAIGCRVDYYIPNRLTEGYGLQEKALLKLSAGTENIEKILITVDNGISAHKAVHLAGDLGYQTIITDHHIPTDTRVPADAVLNPKQASCSFPDKNLAGVGVAFFLAMGIRNHLVRTGFFQTPEHSPNLKRLLDLVAVGTVADMVPLSGINRTLVKAGMEAFAIRANSGLTELCHQTNLDCSYMRSEDIAFQLAPKINAAGRMGYADKAVRLFLSQSKSEAREIASDLVLMNEQRKHKNIQDLSKALSELSEPSKLGGHSLVVAGEYHIGVAGIVASNLVEKYQKPSVVLCRIDDSTLKGSCRSVNGVDLYRVLEDCGDVLLDFGGHPMAGGVSLLKKNVELFKKRFDEAVYRQNKGVLPDRGCVVDADIQIKKLFSKTILSQLHLLEPFGQGNPQPIFRDKSTGFGEISPIGKDKSHLRLTFYDGKTTIKGVAFGLGNMAEACRRCNVKEIHYTPGINFYKGKRNWQARVTKIELDT